MDYLLFRFKAFLQDKGLLEDAYIVGGTVRDILLERDTKDLDIAIKGDVSKIAKEFAYTIDASCVTLDEEFAIMRVIKGQQWIDISRMRCDSLFIDLSERDLTINAMAIPLNSLEDAKSSLIDIYNGVEDLAGGLLRMVSEENFIKDPLRIIRVFRFAVTLDFAIEGGTLQAAKRLVPLIGSVAYERIAEELRIIFLSPHSSSVVSLMTQLKVFTHIFAMTISEGSLVNYTSLEGIIDAMDKDMSVKSNSLRNYLSDKYRLFCLKFASLFDGQKTAIKAAKLLKLSRKEQDLLQRFIARRGKFYEIYRNNKNYYNRGIIELLYSSGMDALGILLLDTALYLGEEPSIHDYAKEVIAFYDNQYRAREPMLNMISGNHLISKLNMPPSSTIKEILYSIHIGILAGQINTPEEALQQAKVLYESKGALQKI